jgi:mannitol-1-/sugar-/sorbitol-6-/2-deoxyglucose-6-phosphatase
LNEPAITSVILDMDGLLIDTEPIWRVAEASVMAGLGIELSETDLLETTGQQISELVACWRRAKPQRGQHLQRGQHVQHGQHDQRGEPREPTDAEVADQITGMVIAHVMAEGQPMEGVLDAIALFGRWGLRLAIASSSPRRLIDAVCERLGLGFITVRSSAAEVIKGKPAPDVYLAAARGLGTLPAHCLAIEDSASGVTAAKSAGMRCIAVPDPQLVADPRYGEADLVLSSLTQLDERALHLLGARPASAADPSR